jgi:Sec-independent protein translocase protein TatA
MGKIPTVQIHDPNSPAGFCFINKADFDPRVHTLWAHMRVTQIRVHNPDDPGHFCLINESAFDPQVHILWNPDVQVRQAEGDGRHTDANLWRPSSAGWTVTYNEAPMTIATKAKGMRAIGHLLSVRRPPGGAREVAAVMDGGVVDPQAVEQYQEDGHVIGLETPQTQMTPHQVRHLKKTTQAAQAEFDAELEMQETTRERREELLSKKKKIEHYVSGSVNIRGQSRRWGRNDAHRVGRAIDRALRTMKKQAEVAADPLEQSSLEKLHRHLADYILSRYSDEVRYQPPQGKPWTVEI